MWAPAQIALALGRRTWITPHLGLSHSENVIVKRISARDVRTAFDSSTERHPAAAASFAGTSETAAHPWGDKDEIFEMSYFQIFSIAETIF